MFLTAFLGSEEDVKKYLRLSRPVSNAVVARQSPCREKPQVPVTHRKRLFQPTGTAAPELSHFISEGVNFFCSGFQERAEYHSNLGNLTCSKRFSYSPRHSGSLEVYNIARASPSQG